MDGWMDGWLDGWMVGWMDDMDGWIDQSMDKLKTNQLKFDVVVAVH